MIEKILTTGLTVIIVQLACICGIIMLYYMNNTTNK